VPRGAFVRRHRSRIASASVVALLVGAVAVYAVTADGYKAHETELNDGGVWVVNGDKGWSGRINKPINQLDGVVPGDDARLRMDILQDGAAVVAVNREAGRGQAIEPARLALVDGGVASVPAEGGIAMAGGTLATADTATGKVWAVRYDSRLGKPMMNMVDPNNDPVATVGKDAVLTVSQAGTVVAVSAEESTVTRLAASGDSFAKPAEQAVGADAGSPTSVTAVGETVVTLDGERGIVQVIGGPAVTVPADSALQQAGPSADSVLVGTPEALLAIDLKTGDSTEVATSSGIPAAPVRLGACTFGAWSGGTGTVATQCGTDPAAVDELKGKARELVFRVNRGEIVLNDSISGSVWDVQQDKPVKIDTWESFTSRKKKEDDDKKNEERSNADRRPPQARPDSYGIRSGRTTVIHPLDNDSAPEGRLLSIVDVDKPSNGAQVAISPDGQTLVVQMPPRARSTSFEYHINDGRSGLSAHAPVTVTTRGEAANAAPTLRHGYERPTFHVANGASISVPVLADWRDDADGDALVFESAKVSGGEVQGVTARTTSDGRIRLASSPMADAPARTLRVDYTVSDGRAPAVTKALDFKVQASEDETTHPSTAAPDVVRGEVGKPIKIRPLLNDLPGSDPVTRHAELRLGSVIPGQPGVDVKTDLETGVVTVRADKAGTYFFHYDAAFGRAPLARGTVRVDVRQPPRRGGDPVAMPDSLTIFGQSPGVVDVLANDMDPAGSLLMVQRARTEGRGDLDVAVIDGRWLRVSARRPDIAPATQVVSYTVSNGNESTEGELVVTQRPQPEDNTPITTPDHAVVRSGSSVTVPVLDNDISPSGDRLTLMTDVAEGTPGELRVVAPVDFQGDRGKAFASGRVLRFVAPTGLKERETFEVPYVAQNLAGGTAEGRARITVVPQNEDNAPPEPPVLEGRVVAGDTVKVRLPGAGVDPDGDPVTVTGISSAPRLGRITSYGGNYVEYRAYPRSTGTDEFSYAVTDGQGGVATGTARIAVVALGEPQPPLAVADRMVVKPGRTATLDPLANDFIAPGDRVRVELIGEPEGVDLDTETNLVRLKAPDDASAPSLEVVYRITNGLAESRATMTLDVDPEYNNPPVVFDSFGRVGDSEAVQVDVLEGAYDPDGPIEDITVVEVLGDASDARISGSTITIERRKHPQVVPFRIQDGDGGSATASVYVPSTGEGLPFVKPDAMIELDVNGSVTTDISDHVESPDGSALRLVDGQEAVAGSPSAINVTRDGSTGITVEATGGYRGPGAALVEVTTATDAGGNEDENTASDGATALVSIPVQVGDDKPELHCPTNVFDLSAGQQLRIDLAAVCQVWTVDPRDAAGLAYTAEWSTALDDVTLGGVSGSVLALDVSSSADRGGQGTIDVRAGESNTAQLKFRLAAAPSPTMLPIALEQMKAGESRTLDLAPYLQGGVADPAPTVVSIQPIGAAPVRATSSGSKVTFAVSDKARGRVSFRVRMSDVSTGDPAPSRIAEGRIDLEIGGVPGKPSPPQIYRDLESGRIDMDWVVPDDGGARITHYNLEVIGTKVSRTCRTNVCSIGGLKKEKGYRFRVRAVNKVGAGEWSDPSQEAVALTRPGRVRDITMKSQGDGTITIAWKRPSTGAQRLIEHEVSWSGGSTTLSGQADSFTATGLSNNSAHTFTIRVRNEVGVSDPRESPAFWPLGTPAAPTGMSATDIQAGSAQTSVRLAWDSTLPEGEGETTYTVSYTAGSETGTVPGCANLTAVRCVHSGVPYDGRTYSYVVRASNAGGNRSPASAAATFEAIGRPAEWGNWTATPTGDNQKFRVDATVPSPRGKTAEFSVLVNGVVQGTQRVREGQGISAVFQTPSNSLPHSVQLRLCNENASNGCTLSAAKSVHTYGPFADGHLIVAQGVGSGQTVTWQVSGDTNGPTGTLTWSLSTGESGSYPMAAGRPASTFSLPITAQSDGYNKNVTLTVSLADPATSRRAVTKVVTAPTGPPPPPEIVVSRGAACNDDPASSLDNCRPRNDDPECTADSCARVHLKIVGFEEWGNSTWCSITSHASGEAWTFPGLKALMTTANPSRDLDWYSTGKDFTVSCSYGRDSSVSASPSTW
jgi:hypothetical protein